MSRRGDTNDDNMARVLQGREYKIIVIGALGVGKTSLMMRFVHDQFEDRLSRFVAEEEKSLTIDGKEVHLKIWDTAGQERYQSITNRFYGDTHAVLIVYDIVQEESWSDVDFWVRELQYYLPQELDNGMPVLFVGNKKDLVVKNDDDQKRVNFRQVQEVANAYHFLPPIEVSAKTGQAVDKAFLRMVRELQKRTDERQRPAAQPIVPLPPRKCCVVM